LAIYAGDLANGEKVSNYQRIKLMEESAVPSIVNPKPRMEPASGLATVQSNVSKKT
jgi:hypothetical protein